MGKTYKVIYDKKQYDKDIKSFEETENGNSPLDLSSFKRLMVHELCCNTEILNNHSIGCYSLEDIQEAMICPQRGYSILVEASRYLMSISPLYMRLNTYFSNMGIFNYIVDTYDVKNIESEKDIEKFNKSYFNVCSQIEKMNLKHEFSKIMSVLPSEDVYYGLLMESDTDAFYFRLPYSMCKLIQIQDGTYNFAMELSAIDPINIGAYPDYIQEAYIAHKNKIDFLDGWYVPPADKQICIKLNENRNYPYPLLISLVGDIFDIDRYKKLKMQKARVDNYKAIIIEIPIDKNVVDKPLLTEETIMALAETNKESMPDDVGLLHTFGNSEAISFKDNTNNTNNLSDSINDTYNFSGVPNQLFGNATSGAALKLSIENDASFVYRVYRQFERYMNRFIKLRRFNKASYKFKFRIQDSTVFNKDVVSDGFLKAAEHGLPFKIDYAVSLGISQNQLLGKLFTENVALELHNQLIPLPTSYTMSSDNVGRPTNESKGEDLSDSGERTSDNETNVDR